MALTKVKAGNILLTTPGASSNDVTPATTAYVTTALANLADSAPSTLDTLNELAAALGDDANFSTTVTNSIAAKLPLAGGTLTGNLAITKASPKISMTSTGSGNDSELYFGTASNGRGIYLDDSDANKLKIYDGSGKGTAGEVTIDNTGQVGIGTTAPAEKLHIFNSLQSWNQYANIRMSTESDSYAAEIGFHRGTGDDSDRGLFLSGDGTNKHVRVLHGGNVGIGVASPASRLHVYSSAATSAPKDQNAVALFDDTEGRIQVRATNSGSDGAVVGLSTGSHNWGLMATAAGTFSNAFAIGYVDTSTDGNVFGVGSMSEKLIITTSGNVGIGETSPSNAKLEILQAGNFDAHSTHGIAIHSTGNTNFTSMYMGAEDGIDAAYIQSAALDGSFTSKSLLLNANGGNVGIGTAAPQHELQVFGAQPTLSIRDSTSGGSGTWTLGREIATLNFMTSDTTGMGAHAVAEIKVVTGSDGQASPPGDMTFCTGSYNNAAAEAGRFTHGKSFIVGNTAEPTGSNGGGSGFITDSVGRRNLVLATTSTGLTDIANFRNPNGTVGTIRTNGSGTSYYTSSDYRLKENVVTDWDATTRLKQLKPSRFNFIADADTTLDGFLAHEVQDIVPEATHGTKDELDSDGNPEYQGIDHARLVPLLTKAMQEQQTLIENLTARIATLEE